MKRVAIALYALALSACASWAPPPSDSFFENIATLCGQSFEGRVVTTDVADASFASQRLVMHVRECTSEEVRIPFHVGEDRSRTWVVSRHGPHLRLKHDHRHQDGSEDALTQYGGDSAAQGGSPWRQEFPADEFSKRLFRDNNIPASVDNVWAMEIYNGRIFAYELRRPNRHFRLEFDLTAPIEAPPPPWGAD
jgi:hypothetical protein